MISGSTASILTSLTGIMLVVLMLRPLIMLRWYMVLRPAINPLAYFQYTFFGIMPIGTPHVLIFSAAGILVSLGPNKRLFPANLFFIYAYFFFSIPSIFFAPSLTEAISVQAKTLTGLTSFLIAYNYIRGQKDLKYFLLSIAVFSSAIPLAYGAYQFVTKTGNIFTYFYDPRRISSVFAQANAFGEYLNILIFVLIGMLLSNYYKKYRKYLLLILVAAVTESIMSQNRGAWIGLIAGLLAAMMVYRRVFPIRWALIGGISTALAGGTFILSRFEMLNTVGQWGYSQNTFAGRLSYAVDLLNQALESPFVGKGLGYVFKLPSLPHNDFMWVFLESGFFAVLVFLFFHITTLLMHLKNRNSANWRCFQFSFFAISVYFSIHSCFQNIFSNPSIFPFFMACFGASAKLMTLEDEVDNSAGAAVHGKL